MKKVILASLASSIILFSSVSFAASITGYSPQGAHQKLRDITTHLYAHQLDAGVTHKKDATGQQFLDFRFSNGSKSEVTMPFAIVCGKKGGPYEVVHRSHQYLGFSLHGSVVRHLYFKVDCPSPHEVGIVWGKVKEHYNLIDLTLKAATAYFFPIEF